MTGSSGPASGKLDVLATTIDTRLGPVQGRDRDDVFTFLGLPYAAPPVGPLRWRAPRPAASWAGTLDALSFPNRSLQPPYPEVLKKDIPGAESEDCLYLNIYTPGTEGANRPVLCWIHGGAYVQGSANEYDGTVLAREHDVVIVAINYRLGVYGFADVSALGEDYIGSVSRGFQDQIAALTWISDNIADYGGDPNCVTLCGESAGAGSVLALQGAPAAQGLYHSSIAFSPGDIGTEPASDTAAALAAHLDIEADLEERLLAIPAQDLLDLQLAGVLTPGQTVDGTVITQPTAAALTARGESGPPLIIGCNKDEGTLFTAGLDTGPQMLAMVKEWVANKVNPRAPDEYRQFVDGLLPDRELRKKLERMWYDLFRASTLRNALAATAAGCGGWVYNFNVPTNNPLGVTHASDIAFTFNSFAAEKPRIVFHENNDANRVLANLWSAAMVQFARTGDPNGSGLPQWPQYDAVDQTCLVFDDQPHIETDPDGVVLRKAYGLS